MIEALGFFMVQQDDQDFISAAETDNKSKILMYISFEKAKKINVILNSKNDSLIDKVIEKIKRYK